MVQPRESAQAATPVERPVPRADAAAALRVRRAIVDRAMQGVLALAAASSIAVTLGIVYILISESVPFFRAVGLKDFLTDTMWTPQFAVPRYGIVPLLTGTLVTTMVALAVALPVGTIIAIWLSEFAPARLRETVKPVLELLAAVPTVVYGYFALLFVTPLLQRLWPGLPTFNMLGAGLVMGVMIIPYVSSLSEDAMRAVPMLLREGSFAVGGNKIVTATRVVFPAALSGIAAAYVLGISRAVGETMIVAVAAGQQPLIVDPARPLDALNPGQPGATITAFIVSVSLGDVQHGEIGYQAIFAAGLTLFVATLGFNVAGYLLRKRFRQAY